MAVTLQGTLEYLCQQLAAQLTEGAESGKSLRVVGFTGPPGAGKSRAVALVNELLHEARLGVAPLVAGLLPMDGFHKSNAVLADEGLSNAKGTPDSFDVVGYLMALNRVHDATTVVYAPGYDRDLGEAVAAAHRVGRVGTVLTEGNYLAIQDGPWAMVREVIDLLIYLEVPAEVTRARLLERHQAGGKLSAQQAAQWVREVDDPNRLLVEGSKSRVDQIWVVGE